MRDRAPLSAGPAALDLEHLRLLVEHSLDGLCLTHPDGRVVFVNPAACAMLGRTAAEVCRLGDAVVLDGDDPRRPAAGAELERTGRFAGELTCLRADGSRFPAEVVAHAFPGVDGRRWTSTSFRDVSRRRAAEDALIASETRQRQLLRSAGLAVIYTDLAGRIVLANPAAAALLGDAPERLVGRTPRDFLPAAAAEEVMARIERAVAADTAHTYETRYDGADGPRWILARYGRVAGPGGAVEGVQITATDLSEHRRVEEALRDSEQRYRSLFATMSEGFALHEIICDDAGRPVDYRFLDANPAFFALTGLPQSAIGRTVTEVIPGIEPVWIETYGRIALAGGTVHLDQPSEALGKRFEVHAFSPQRGQFATLFLDVSEQRRAEQTAQRRLRQLTAVSRLGITLAARLEVRDLLETAVREIQASFA